MNIYFVNKKSTIKGPFSIINAKRQHIICIGDICIYDTEKKMSILLVTNDENKWDACKSLYSENDMKSDIEANTLLFSFDGLHQRFGRREELRHLRNCFCGNKYASGLFTQALDILDYKKDLWDMEDFTKLIQLSCHKQTGKRECNKSQNAAPLHTLFASYLRKDQLNVFKRMTSKGFDLKTTYMKIRQQYPSEFRDALRRFLLERPHNNIYDCP